MVVALVGARFGKVSKKKVDHSAASAATTDNGRQKFGDGIVKRL
jgi:hypothetical protein